MRSPSPVFALLAVLALSSVLLLASELPGQELRFTVEGRPRGTFFGETVARLSDWNGDGVREIAVGAPGFSNEAGADVGRTIVLDGASREAVRVFTGLLPGDQLGGSLCGRDDLDGDGIPDLVIGSGVSPRDPDGDDFPPLVDGLVQVFSGACGSLLRERRGSVALENLGASVVVLDDWDGDAVPDLGVGSTGIRAAGHARAGRVTVVSGADLSSPIRVRDGTGTLERLGTSLARLGDLDQDGHDDLAVGAPGFITTPGTVVLLPGPAGSARELAGPEPGSRFGAAVAAVGDLDGDGLPELLVGSPRDDPDPHPGEAFVLSSAGGYSVWRRYGGATAASRFGAAVADAGDVDGDGSGDHAIGAPADSSAGTPAGAVYVFSGEDGSLLFRVDGDDPGDRFGASCAGGVGAPRFSDLLVGAPLADPSERADAGSVSQFRIAPALPCLPGSVGAGAGAEQPVLSVNGSIGRPRDRVLVLDRDDPLTVRMDAAPGRTRSRFALYAYAGFPGESTIVIQPFGLGTACFGTPVSGNFDLPRVIWNNLGEPLVFGVPTHPSVAAPSEPLRRASGAGRRARGTLQGIVRDDQSIGPDGLSVTNAVLLDVR